MLTHKEFKDLWMDDCLEEIEDDIDDSWRHGNNHNTIFQRCEYNKETDELVKLDEYYQASYQVSGDGEQHGIRDMVFEFGRVWPVTKVVTRTETHWMLKEPTTKAPLIDLECGQ